jgi:putative oxidoreductase
LAVKGLVKQNPYFTALTGIPCHTINVVMKKLTSTNYSTGAFNFALLVLRIGAGILLMSHGYDKLAHFKEFAPNMPSLFGIGQTPTLVLIIFAEFFCALFVVLGLFTRLACIPVIITMSYALIFAHKGDVFNTGEKATLFLVAFLTILILGPGKISVDGMTGK